MQHSWVHFRWRSLIYKLIKNKNKRIRERESNNEKKNNACSCNFSNRDDVGILF